MDCPNCHEKTRDPLTCNQCGSTFCHKCNPYFAGELCQACQESNSISEFKDDAYTSKLRKWFNRKAPPPKAPELKQPLPWSVLQQGESWVLMSGVIPIAEFDRKDSAEWACKAANDHYQLMGVASRVYNAIREGNSWFDGTESDIKLWQNVRKLIK